MAITHAQRDILIRVRANYSNGLSSAEASQRRNATSRGRDGGTRGLNTVRPPLNCPKWVCCLLPCINHIPSMKQFRLVQPDDAEVLRDGHWIRYDHASLVVGDIVRLVEGDVIPADCTIISLGMDHVDESIVIDEETRGSSCSSGTSQVVGSDMDIIVDSHLITGEAKPRQISNKAIGAVNLTTLYFGSRILQGACMAVVTATGNRVMLAKLIKSGRWPPHTDMSEEVDEINRMEYLEAGIALTPIS